MRATGFRVGPGSPDDAGFVSPVLQGLRQSQKSIRLPRVIWVRSLLENLGRDRSCTHEEGDDRHFACREEER